ncbi:Z1 domain-containing protein [Rhodoferax sp.]|uniref:Z1 domain-containing protein n=1 Tax=Rhodoferax sp. TaxID=50421 RepID=UPI002772A750|nr:Z1 domain-containing protein [Rhodoferax sp.]
MAAEFDIKKLKEKSKSANRYSKQLARLHASNVATGCIEQAVDGAIANLGKAKNASLVIYGEPQSGKTEMMICLTAKLLDQGHRAVVHLLNDSVDLLSQNLKRFKQSSLAPAPKTSSELINSGIDLTKQDVIVFCKKNARDLEKLTERLKGVSSIVVIDDEADYATPNSKINQQSKSPINQLVEQLLGQNGYYIGVTATPARLDLNATLNNEAEHWVQFPAHEHYTGQDVFFPIEGAPTYNRVLLDSGNDPQHAREALLRFLVRSAYLNSYTNSPEKNYSFLVHTSGKKDDHNTDRIAIEKAIEVLSNSDHEEFPDLIKRTFELAAELYPNADANRITEYVSENASRMNTIVLNSERDRKAAGDNPTEPTSPFSIIIGGNIVSRGVTFPNLLAMYFTRDVAHKLQQDTYIQRARMFGARGDYLEHFELTIPKALYADWQKCFTFHRLALYTIKESLGSPVWIGDSKVSVASAASINKATVSFNRGEMSFQMFDITDELKTMMLKATSGTTSLHGLREKIGNPALPEFLIKYIERTSPYGDDSVVFHPPSDISGQTSAGTDVSNIARQKGFMGKSQIQENKYPKASHHVKVFFNSANKARVFYKLRGVEFIQNN